MVCDSSANSHSNCHNCQSRPLFFLRRLFLFSSTASPSIKLLVEDPIVVNPGQTVSLVCITTGGEPPPILTWVSTNDSLPQRSVVNGGTLTLPAITSEEAGVYSCVASNNVGNPAKKSTTIVVRGEETRHLNTHRFIYTVENVSGRVKKTLEKKKQQPKKQIFICATESTSYSKANRLTDG